MKAFLREHGEALGEALRRLARQAFGSLLTILVVGLAGALPLGLHQAARALADLTRGLGAEPTLTVFAQPGAATEVVQALGERLRQHGAARQVRLVSREEALESLRRDAGLRELIDGLEANPLPDAWVVSTGPGEAAALEALRAEASAWPGVDQVLLDAEWARQLTAGTTAVRRLALFLGGLLGLALLAVSFNTIRLQVLTRRDEIEVVKLIGGTDGFIRRPFLYFGALQGAAGGLVAFAIALAAGGLVSRALPFASSGIAATLGPGTEPGPLMVDLVAVMGVGGTLGWMGAWLSVSGHLRCLNPRP